MKVLAIIPARGGSKRLPGKNIKELAGKPLIEYTCQAVKESKLITKAILSSDCPSIIDLVAETCPWVNVPFIRPSAYSADTSSDYDVINHSVTSMAALGEHFDIIVYCRPTTPFKTGLIIDQVLESLVTKKLSGVRTVTRAEGVFHPYWMYSCENGLLKEFCKDGGIKRFYQSQQLPDCYRLNGVVDAFRVDNLKKNDLYGNKVGFIELRQEESIDIDTWFDFKLAQFFMEEGVEKIQNR